MSDLENITIYMPFLLSNAIEAMIQSGKFKSRSQFVRICLEEFLDKEEEFMETLKTNPEINDTMIISVNIPKKRIKHIKEFIGDNGAGLFPSRSELIRVAIRDFIIKENYIDWNLFSKENSKNPEAKALIKKLILNRAGLTFINYTLRKRGFVGTSMEIYRKMKSELITSGQIEILSLKGGEQIEIIHGE